MTQHPSNITPEHHVLASIEGVGVLYEVVADDSFAVFAVYATSGPSRTHVDAFDSFVVAARYIIDEIERDLSDDYDEAPEPDDCRPTCAARRDPNAECVCAELDGLDGPSAAELRGDYGINGRDRNV